MALLPLVTTGCFTDDPPPNDLVFGPYGSIAAPSGKTGFRFGAASAATQIEDQNPNVDWYVWSKPAPDGLGNNTFVGDASMGYTKALEDVDLIASLHLDSYRFSMEWARIEPKRGQIDEEAIQHYRDFLLALKERGIRPNVTVHHFSNPIWVDDPRAAACTNGPSDENLCGLNHPEGGPLVIEAMQKHAKLLGERFGDLVDDWATVNEPVNYLLAAYGVGSFPPGKQGLFDIPGKFVPTFRNYIAAHAAMYQALKAADTVDADGDGIAANVGLTKEVGEWVAASGNMPSDAPVDVKARDKVLWLYQYLFVEALVQGGFDSDLDGEIDEPHPEWKGTLDWLGVQYYSRSGVTGSPGVIPILNITPCYGGFDLGACLPPLDPTFFVPTMNYEHDPAGLFVALKDFGERWPDLPLTVTESGIATEVGARRAEVIVRALEQIQKAKDAGVDVRGYYHWSIYDNFEWALGFTPRFGLYTVDFATYNRTPTEGATVFGEIAQRRKVLEDQRHKYGGDGPLTPETVKE
ncbi:Beta-galactosidase [Minicystis rosea]|nr:Beta-galactosidase [Minicystis rosea]